MRKNSSGCYINLDEFRSQLPLFNLLAWKFS